MASRLSRRYPNVVVVRTFSKAYGLAGLRVGYGFCAPELARKLWTMQQPFGIAITGLVAVAASYDAESELQQRIRMITAERRYMRMRLRAMGVYSTDAHANFVYLPSWGRQWREVFDDSGLRSVATPTVACASPSVAVSPPAQCWARWVPHSTDAGGSVLDPESADQADRVAVGICDCR